ncbi:MAG: DUF5343 domain-containing protein [Shewanella sp.]|uniref:DUF5343 domain-containing protein n=1 Tax=Shewanella sp. TaxID=50422 RepID=UPI0026474E45|nr:DUF5343 domain-containing protein [Shewanella sp.]MDN5501731.1 DUF5343 domain-containing protein [Shewanella sp.]MDN5528060.1 DUF5343 domain-containing protein [Shewanella sp.]
MSSKNPPYMTASGLVGKILDKIKVAATPDRFTQDYLATELGFSGGSAKAFIPLAKRIGLIGSDGAPTEIYKQFRSTNAATSKAAIATAIKTGYADLYLRNEYVHSLSKAELEGLVIELTGLEKGNQTIRAIVGTFESLKSYADFSSRPKHGAENPPPVEVPVAIRESDSSEDLKLNLSYTINIVLPKTDDIAVFNAIFRSLKDNLLSK